MTEQSSATARASKTTLRVPPRLLRILVVATAIYFIGFIWTFTGGALGRLSIPYQWEMFFFGRRMAETFNGQWFLYGTSVSALFVNWIVLLGVITGGYTAFVWIAQKNK